MSVRARADFRGDDLTGSGGFDSLGGANSGSIATTSTDPPVGVYAADWPDISDAYGVRDIEDSDSLYAYIYLIVDSAPSTDQTLIQFLSGGTVVGEIDMNSSRQLELKNNGTLIGSASSALELDQLYRIGLRQVAGSGADGELEGYLAANHKNLVSFADSDTESFTADVDEIRVGACNGTAFDGRIGLLAARSDRMPRSWLEVHDVLVGPLGFLKYAGSGVSTSDMQPAYDRAAIGERQHDSYSNTSFIALANFAGGVGQSRMMSQDRVLTGVFDGRFEGYAFPPRAAHEATGGTTTYFFNRGSDLYGFNSTVIENIATGATTSIGIGLRNPLHAPIVDGFNNVYWTSDDNNVAKWTGSGSPVDVTPDPAGNYDVTHVAAFDRFIWAFSETEVPSLDIAQSNSNHSTGSNRSVSLSSTPLSSTYTCVIAIVAYYDSFDIGDSITPEDGWDLIGSVDTETDDGIWAIAYQRFGGGADSQTFEFEMDGGGRTFQAIIEINGVDPDQTFSFGSDADDGTGSETELTATSETGDLQLGVIVYQDGHDPSVESGWNLIESDAHQILIGDIRIYEKTTSDDSFSTTSYEATAAKIAMHIGNIMEPEYAGTNLIVVHATDASGETWTAIPLNFGMNLFGNIRASVATAGSLWLVTDQGLFRMSATGDETGGGVDIITVAFTQHDRWERPRTDNTGKWVATFQGQIFYPVGATIRRYTPNSDDPNQDRAFWPNTEWATVADEIQALVANEAGIWWGAAGYLWNHNGRGTQQVAIEPESGAYDYLFWHEGRLYFKDDPAGYYEYGYPTVRPDILINQGVLDQDDFDTGYIITPSIDFEKVIEPKVVRLLKSQVTFTNQSSGSGSVTWHYRNGCGTDEDPGVLGGGDLASTWTLWGNHDFDDGGFHQLSLDDPLQCYRLYVRATLTPGNTGIPVLNFFAVWGHALLDAQKRLVIPTYIHVDQFDREYNVSYDEYEQVMAAYRTLHDMRDLPESLEEPLTFEVTTRDGSDGGKVRTMLFSQMEDTITEESEDERKVSIKISMAFEELPG